MVYPPLTREELKSVIHGKGAGSRVPLLYHFWCDPHVFGERSAQAEALLQAYPSDAQCVSLRMPDVAEAPQDAPQYKWIFKDSLAKQDGGIDARIAMADWDELEEVLAHFPDPGYEKLVPAGVVKGEKYLLAHWWYFFFERFWSLRGMENALTDFYLYPEQVHRLFDRLADFYYAVLRRAKAELGADGIFTSDDIGTQNAPFFSLDIFREFFKPYYKKVVDQAHALGMDFWLHTCGNIELFLPDLIEIGVDVLHPIQKHTMDEAQIARRFGDQICIWAGFDVQQTIPYGTPEEVRAEVRHLMDVYARRDGRFMMTLGNAATGDTPMESLHALLEESCRYGAEKMQSLGADGQGAPGTR
ncbi:MAG: uroporphyrinogen decarboxylase family protein [Eubacteriales bacterium]|nr:uroporphyrinogen decarboxylase family protein [Eubacteriales bacterium]